VNFFLKNTIRVDLDKHKINLSPKIIQLDICILCFLSVTCLRSRIRTHSEIQTVLFSVANAIQLNCFWYNLELLVQCGTFNVFLVQSKFSGTFWFYSLCIYAVQFLYVTFLEYNLTENKQLQLHQAMGKSTRNVRFRQHGPIKSL
jgi:hypothetical protein